MYHVQGRKGRLEGAEEEQREKVGTTTGVRRSWESRFAGKGASRTGIRFFWIGTRFFFIGTRICLSHSRNYKEKAMSTTMRRSNSMLTYAYTLSVFQALHVRGATTFSIRIDDWCLGLKAETHTSMRDMGGNSADWVDEAEDS